MEQAAAQREDILFGKVDVTDEMELAEQFGIFSVPTLVLMHHGQVVEKKVGLQPKESILALADAAGREG